MLAPTETKLTGLGYTRGLVALDAPGTLVAEHAGTVLRSTDSGCTWKAIGAAPNAPLNLSPAGAARAYAWQDNGTSLLRIEGETVTPLTSPTGAIVGLAASKANPKRVRLGGEGASLWDSKDGGDTWEATGMKAPVDAGLLYRIAFDPSDLDHALVGVAKDGIAVTKDGGQSWELAKGLASGAKGANAFSIAVSPSDGKIVWAEGIDLTENLANQPGEGRHIWRSTDGGLTFAPVVGQTPDITLKNGTLLVPHPTKTDVLYFVFGTYFQGYGTDLYRYDEATKGVTKTHNGYDDVSAIAFSPADPGVMFLGLTWAKPN